MLDTEEAVEKVVLVGVSLKDNDDTEKSIDELEDLVATAGAVTVSRVIQNRATIDSATYVGKGKMDEIKEEIIFHNATGIVCDDELTPAQMKNMEEELEVKVMDRTMVILDIFASRASTSEGKIQVELAQLKYRSSRLTGRGTSLSRLGGGIGTRGPGEKKLEVDRRVIRDRISQLNKELEEVKRHRDVQRKQRSKNQTPVVCIVGYTNAGKSTLLNRLTDAGVLEEDKLFATLDPTTRNLVLPDGQEILLTDTVGFIRKLPHHLINAFRSTLEEAKYSDLIIHVVDGSNPQMDEQMHTVYETLDKLEVGDKTIITAFNKMDKLSERPVFKDFKADKTVYMSAINLEGADNLLQAVQSILKERKVYIEKLFDFKDAGKIQIIRKYGQLISEEYVDNGIYVKAYIDVADEGRL